MPDTDTVALGVELLSKLDMDEISLADTIDRIETITTDPATTRAILDTAEARGVIERENGVIHTRSGASVHLSREVVTREGEFICQRCGASLSIGHFLQLEAGEHGPFGPTCIRIVLGQESPSSS